MVKEKGLKYLNIRIKDIRTKLTKEQIEKFKKNLAKISRKHVIVLPRNISTVVVYDSEETRAIINNRFLIDVNKNHTFNCIGWIEYVEGILDNHKDYSMEDKLSIAISSYFINTNYTIEYKSFEYYWREFKKLFKRGL